MTLNNHEKTMETLWEICLASRKLLDSLENITLKEPALQHVHRLKELTGELKEHPRFTRDMADSYFKKRRWGKALELFAEMPDDNKDTVMKKGDIYLNLKDYEKAQEYYEKLLEMDEKDSIAWFKKANMYYLMGSDLENSVFYLEKSLDLNHDNIDALILMSKIWLDKSELKKDKYLKQRMLEESLDCLKTAQKQNEDDPPPIREFNLARIEALYSRLEPEKEMEHLEKVAEYLQEAIDGDESELLMIRDMIKTEKIFTDLDIELVFESGEEGEHHQKDEERPGGEAPESDEESGSSIQLREVLEENPGGKLDGKLEVMTPEELMSEKPPEKKSRDEGRVPEKVGMINPEDIYGED